jgi:hypothetical protein
MRIIITRQTHVWHLTCRSGVSQQDLRSGMIIISLYRYREGFGASTFVFWGHLFSLCLSFPEVKSLLFKSVLLILFSGVPSLLLVFVTRSHRLRVGFTYVVCIAFALV